MQHRSRAWTTAAVLLLCFPSLGVCTPTSLENNGIFDEQPSQHISASTPDKPLEGWLSTDARTHPGWQLRREFRAHGTSNATRYDFDPRMFGKLALPVAPDTAAAACSDFAQLCAREAAQRYEDAFAGYEARMAQCGMSGWKNLGFLGSGNEVSTMLLETPCGLRTAVRSHAQAVSHIRNGCVILKELLEDFDKPWCDGCIPRYYHYSTLTGSCYEEHIPAFAGRVSRFITSLHAERTQFGLRALKHYFNDGLRALYTLQRHGTVHRDLGFTNILVRLVLDPTDANKSSIVDGDEQRKGDGEGAIAATLGSEADNLEGSARSLELTAAVAGSHHASDVAGQGRFVPWRLVFIDFGWAISNTVPMRHGDHHRSSAVPHTDAYYYACEFYQLFAYGPCGAAAGRAPSVGAMPRRRLREPGTRSTRGSDAASAAISVGDTSSVAGKARALVPVVSQLHMGAIPSSRAYRREESSTEDPTTFKGFLAAILRAGYDFNSSAVMDFKYFHKQLQLVERV